MQGLSKDLIHGITSLNMTLWVVTKIEKALRSVFGIREDYSLYSTSSNISTTLRSNSILQPIEDMIL